MDEPPRSFVVPPEAGCLDGHFPGHPIVPAVVILDAVIAEAQRRSGTDWRIVGIDRCKFLLALYPGERCTIVIDHGEGATLSFRCQRDGVDLVKGRLQRAPA